MAFPKAGAKTYKKKGSRPPFGSKKADKGGGMQDVLAAQIQNKRFGKKK